MNLFKPKSRPESETKEGPGMESKAGRRIVVDVRGVEEFFLCARGRRWRRKLLSETNERYSSRASNKGRDVRLNSAIDEKKQQRQRRGRLLVFCRDPAGFKR
ncbi:hypothetical protein EVAR_42734_1 [Eumeta japonica]|uniref:Uncharacterized protein n=1 Tax=Eumeta variegata TaxID=151549 RepID=A0A4C1XKV9_EUMVA|nr:hypothetical protein EVAR_42734_1 [Eumeta japonica]